MQNLYDCVIIGGGVSGLLTASLLAKHGQKVAVLEKNRNCGGMMQSFVRKGVSLDTGMHFFGSGDQRQIQSELFAIFGVKTAVSKIQTGFSFVLNGKKYQIPATGFEDFEKKMTDYFPSEKRAIQQYTETIKKIVQGVSVASLSQGLLLKKEMETGAFDFICSITQNVELREVLGYLTMLYAGNKNTTSLYLHALTTGTFIQSAYQFSAGATAFIDDLQANIKQHGGDFFTQKKVETFAYSGNKMTACVCADGSRFYAKNFVSSIHPSVLLSFVDEKRIKSFYKRRVQKIKNSPGAFLVYLLMQKDTFPKLPSPLILAENTAWDVDISPQNTLLIHTPTGNEESQYASYVKMMYFVDSDSFGDWKSSKSSARGKEYEAFKNQLVENLLQRVEAYLPHLKKNIRDIYTASPLTFSDYTATPGGTAYGLVHDYNHFLATAVPVQTKIPNLFLTGQSINFHGLTGVSISALLTCSAVLKTKIFS